VVEDLMNTGNKVTILKEIPAGLDLDKILKQINLHGNTQRFKDNIQNLLEIVSPIARPKAIFKIGCIENKTGDSVEIDGIKFTSQLLRDNLEHVDSVFICLATCGIEVEAIEIPAGDVIKLYCLDMIKLALVTSASNYFQSYLTKEYGLGEFSCLNPGELKQFPIEMQKKLFTILGDVEGMIGVRLTENCALVPTKSRSGIFFSQETPFISCRMCLQQRCQARRAAYDPKLANRYKISP
jgi:hypothetical protein